jgi:hypothetical protein
MKKRGNIREEQWMWVMDCGHFLCDRESWWPKNASVVGECVARHSPTVPFLLFTRRAFSCWRDVTADYHDDYFPTSLRRGFDCLNLTAHPTRIANLTLRHLMNAAVIENKGGAHLEHCHQWLVAGSQPNTDFASVSCSTEIYVLPRHLTSEHLLQSQSGLYSVYDGKFRSVTGLSSIFSNQPSFHGL